MTTHYDIVVIGGGNAGISVSALLLRRVPGLKLAIIEPSDKHYYQPAWTLVGGGVYDIRKTVRNEVDIIPKQATWVRDAAVRFEPEAKQVITASGKAIGYGSLIVCPGIQINWNAVKGLSETLGQNGVCTNYGYNQAPYTFECIRNFKRGTALFHSPDTVVKCGGAPYKIMYLAADYFRRHHIAATANIQFYSGGTRLFAVEKYEKTFRKVVERNNIHLHFRQRLIEIDGANRKALFEGIGPENNGMQTWVDFEFMHVTPPQGPPDFIRNSPLSDAKGWVDVDKHTLQHTRYPEIFALGDASSLPTSKTGAAIRKQTSVLAANLLAQRAGKPLRAHYHGYTSCPVVTGYGKLVLAEFDYNNQPCETFPFDQSRERWSMYQLKTKILPWMYWNKILKGKMQG